MPSNHKSEANESAGRTKLLSSRPEPDNYVGKIQTPPLYNRTEVSK